jgi:hypothetical protein
MIDPSMAGKTGLRLFGLLLGKTVAGMARVALTIFPTDGMAPTAALLRVDHLRWELHDLLELINRSPGLGMLTRFEPGHLDGMTSLTEATHHQACPDRIISGFVVAPMAFDTGYPCLTHAAFPPGYDEACVHLFMAADTDSIILLGGCMPEVQREDDQDKPYHRDPTIAASLIHTAPLFLLLQKQGKNDWRRLYMKLLPDSKICFVQKR